MFIIRARVRAKQPGEPAQGLAKLEHTSEKQIIIEQINIIIYI